MFAKAMKNGEVSCDDAVQWLGELRENHEKEAQDETKNLNIFEEFANDVSVV